MPVEMTQNVFHYSVWTNEGKEVANNEDTCSSHMHLWIRQATQFLATAYPYFEYTGHSTNPGRINTHRIRISQFTGPYQALNWMTTPGPQSHNTMPMHKKSVTQSKKHSSEQTFKTCQTTILAQNPLFWLETFKSTEITWNYWFKFYLLWTCPNWLLSCYIFVLILKTYIESHS
jgi:hypothetical protein